MQLFIAKQGTLQTFSGADSDLRYARDDVDEPALRNLYTPVRNERDDDDPTPPDEGEPDDNEEKMHEYWKGM